MVYLTIIACIVIASITFAFVAWLLKETITEINDLFYDYASHRTQTRLEEFDSIGKMFSQMVYGPGNAPAKSAEEIIKELVGEEDSGPLPYPLHEAEDEFLRWIPNEDDEVKLLDLPEHEEDDQFMNEVDNA